MNNINIGNYRRVTKTTAKKLFLDGHTIRVCGHKIDPTNNFYNLYFDYNLSRYTDNPDFEYELCKYGLSGFFDYLINNFSWYNCNYECGYYPAFYICE